MDTTNSAYDIMCLNTNSVHEYMYLSINCAHDYMHLKTNDYIYFNINVPIPTCIYIQMIIMITAFVITNGANVFNCAHDYMN